MAQIRQGPRPAEQGYPGRKRSWRYPGLRAGEVRERPDSGLRDFEAASWIWHRLLRPGLSPIRIGDPGEPAIQADQVVKQLRKIPVAQDAGQHRKTQADERRVVGMLMRHCVLDATVDVRDPGAMALLALSSLGSSKFAGYGMMHIEPIDAGYADHGDGTGGLPTVLGLLEGREATPYTSGDRGA